MRARIARKSSAARGRVRSRRNSSIRARIIGKSSAARGEDMQVLDEVEQISF
jgi:hypothetical protein